MIFAIAIDYTVSLLASAKERYEHSGDPQEAMVGSLAHSGRVIFAAGAVVVTVSFTFALSGPLWLTRVGPTSASPAADQTHYPRTPTEPRSTICREVRCKTCGKTSWAGCGLHVDQVMAGVPRADRCPSTEGRAPGRRLPSQTVRPRLSRCGLAKRLALRR